MNFKIALVFSCHFLSLSAFKEPECTEKLEGDSYTIALNSPKQEGDTLIWKCDEKVIHKRRKGEAEPAASVDDKGSLILTNISKAMACTYRAEHHDRDGKSLKTTTERLCVLSRATVPKLVVESSATGLKCKEILEGDSYTLRLDSPEQHKDSLIWKCGDVVMYNRRRGKEVKTTTVNVDDKGSLILTNISKTMACTYRAEHHDGDGKSLKTMTERLCVLSRTPVPELVVDCSPTDVSTLQCEPKSFPEDITFSWILNDEEINETSNPLSLKHGGEDRYRCRLSNGLNQQDSNEVTMLCGVYEGAPVNRVFSNNKNESVIGLIAGGGFLLLVLIVSAICYKTHHGRWKRLRDEEELHLTNLQHIDSNPCPQQKQRGQSQPASPTSDKQGNHQSTGEETNQKQPHSQAALLRDGREPSLTLSQPRRTLTLTFTF